MCTKTPGKGAVTSQETELASVGVSPVEAWVSSGLRGGRAPTAADLGYATCDLSPVGGGRH